MKDGILLLRLGFGTVGYGFETTHSYTAFPITSLQDIQKGLEGNGYRVVHKEDMWIVLLGDGELLAEIRCMHFGVAVYNAT